MSWLRLPESVTAKLQGLKAYPVYKADKPRQPVLRLLDAFLHSGDVLGEEHVEAVLSDLGRPPRAAQWCPGRAWQMPDSA